MIYYDNGKGIASITQYLNAFSKRTWLEVRKGSELIWARVRSCFGAGFWLNDKPWLNNESWKN